MSHLKNMKREARVLLPSPGETYTADDGTVSQILEGTLDTTQDPTEEEVDEYATWLGMQLPQDAEFLWIAKEGLRTPLPKEWRPCRTSEGDVYYFNFKNGESSWEHPLDQMFRKKFEAEKARVMEERGGATASGGAVTRVLLTDSGVLRKDPNRPTPQPATSSSGGSPEVTATIPQPQGPPASPSPAVAGRTPRCETASPAAAATTPLILPTSIPASSPPQTRLPPSPGPAGGAQRLVSEAERALEERIRAELEREWNKELGRAQALHASQLAALRQQHETEAKTLRDEDAMGRAEAARLVRAAAEEQRAQARRRCAERLGAQLEQLEHGTNTLRTRLGKLDEEYQRAAGGEQRAALERRAAEDRAARLSALEADMAAQRRRALDEARARWAGRMSTVRTQSQDTMARVRAAAQKARTEHEIATVQAAEVQRKEIAATQSRVVAELQALQSGAVAMAPNSSHGDNRGAKEKDTGTPSTSVEVRCRAIRAKAAQAQTQLRQEKDRLLTALRRQWLELTSAAKANAAAGKTSGAPVAVTLVKVPPTVMGGPNAAPTSAFTPVAMTAMSAAQYEGALTDLRANYTRKTRDLMDALAATRQRKLAEIRTAATPTSAMTQQEKTMASLPSSDATLVVKAECEAELRQLEAAYKATQDSLRAELAEELTCATALDVQGGATGTSQEQRVQAVLELDMAAYVQEVEARRGRLAAEFAVRQSKHAAEQDAARAASARRTADQQARRLRERAAAASALLEERLTTAVAAERAKLQRECDAVVARRTASYAKERQATAREVDEEVTAYVRSEREKWYDTAKAKGQKTATRKRRAQERRTTPARRSAAQQRAMRRADWAALRAEETRLLSLLTSRASEAAAPAAPVAVREPLPAHITSAAHCAELRRLEQQYCAEEASLQGELQRWRTTNEALTAQLTSLPPSTMSHGGPPRSFCTEDAIQYCTVQQNEVARRQRYLRAARSLWQRESGYSEEGNGANGVAATMVSSSTLAYTAPQVSVPSRPSSAEQEANLARLLGRLNAQLDHLTRQVSRLRQHSHHRSHAHSTSPSRSGTRAQGVPRIGGHGTRHVDPTTQSSDHSSPRHSAQHGGAAVVAADGVLARKWHAILSSLQDSETGPTWAVFA